MHKIQRLNKTLRIILDFLYSCKPEALTIIVWYRVLCVIGVLVFFLGMLHFYDDWRVVITVYPAENIWGCQWWSWRHHVCSCCYVAQVVISRSVDTWFRACLAHFNKQIPNSPQVAALFLSSTDFIFAWMKKKAAGCSVKAVSSFVEALCKVLFGALILANYNCAIP